jgi:hypothetical protein
MSDQSANPNTEGTGFTALILPTEMLVDIGRRLRDRGELTQTEKEELLSAIMRAIG